MAAYGVKYQIAYYRKSGGRTSIDILQKGYDEGNGIRELLAFSDPLTISFEGDLNNIYLPTIGSGAIIKVVELPLSLQTLFTLDPQEYMIKVYDGTSEDSSSAANIRWQGFINTGIYTESYSTPATIRSVQTIYCNNGMSILGDLLYTNTGLGSGIKYTGFTTLSEVMRNIFSKLEIDFDTIHTCHILKYGAGIYADTTNIFEIISVNNENYYDESGKPMTCREVLDSIFGSLGLVMSLRGTTIYIIDPIDLHNMYNGYIYGTTPTYGSNEQSLGLSEILDITNRDIRWYETGANIDIIQPFNFIDISYDPYNFSNGGYDFNGSHNGGANYSNGGVYSEYTNNGVHYHIYYQTQMYQWTLTGSNYFEGFEEISPDAKDLDNVIRQIPNGTGTFVYTFPFSNIQQDNKLILALSMEVYINTKHVSNIFDPIEGETAITSLYLQNLQVKIGDKWYNNNGVNYDSNGSWSDTQENAWLYVREMDAKVFAGYAMHFRIWFIKWTRHFGAEDTSGINDKWVTATLYMKLSEAAAAGVDLVNGSVSIIIPKALDTSVVTGVKNVLIKNVSVQVIDLAKAPISNDGILTNVIDDDAITVRKAGINLQLTNGTGPYGVSKGAFSSNLQTNVGLNIVGLQRTGSATYYKTTELIAQSLMGQYTSPRFLLHGILNVKDYIDRIYVCLIKDSGYLGTKRFYIVGGTYHDREESMDVDMIELTTTRKSIT